ncbi:MAG TPA: GH116 family glycosyl hydrolase [Phycisphaerae bacterium]|nr:GH116 family glycosyl hydrolase [Phycisphaerae bacterium]HSA29381.1 GH116 family glycosyl hydrolase [Phycisphaerae bacterium]
MSSHTQRCSGAADTSSRSADCCTGMCRRDVLKVAGLAVANAALSEMPLMAGPFEVSDFEKLVPADKKLHPDWVKSLFARGSQAVYRGADLERIGMPVGGICTGQLYLGGDGRLWHWDIFNEVTGTGAEHYAQPMAPSSPLEHGFALRITSGGPSRVRTLDRAGWKDVSFIGEYPLGHVEYRDDSSAVAVSLDAFSPFIPLNADDSALPSTVMRFTLKNTGSEKVNVELAGRLENAVGLRCEQSFAGARRNRIVRLGGLTCLECVMEPPAEKPSESRRPDLVFEDFERQTYEGWTATGTAFGPGPIEKNKMPAYQGDIGSKGERLVNTHNTRNGEDVGAGDAHVGTLTSRAFSIERDYISFLIGGGGHKGRTCIDLLVDGKVVRSATGVNDNRMSPRGWDVRPWAGKTARLQIVDNEKGGWGNIGIDQILFTDQPQGPGGRLSDQPDFGSMALALLEPQPDDRAAAVVREQGGDAALFPDSSAAADVSPSAASEGRLIGALSRTVSLAPQASATVTFVVTWHFPNIKLGGLEGEGGRWYGKRFPNALAVAEYVAANFARLHAQTRLWHDTWYDSTLPYWFLDRMFLNTSILATSTCYWFDSGRFYGWEGVGCCAGTCTHVWHYAQAVGRLFPVLERSLRERADYGAGFSPDTGRIRFRAEHNDHWAVDGQAGCILRTYREHQMSADDAFLRRLWPKVRKSLEFLMDKDPDADGIIDGPQHNTLDADWYGQVAWLSGLYLAAVRAGEEMAREVGDEVFAGRCRAIFDKGGRRVDETLFNGEYYVHKPDEKHARTVGSYDGCEIDQVFGHSWSWQLGLGRITDREKTRSALRSLWRYNYTPDVGPYRAAHKSGRWYAMAGEGGLLMCTWPRGEGSRVTRDYDSYFNECMTGFEYQVAGHMLAEGMLLEGLAIARTIHDRYHPSRRNPWNEVECGDHYARAMASYGVFLAACGYEHHGPKGHLGFAPRLTPDNFRAAFTTAEGWGTFTQKRTGVAQQDTIEMKSGRLRLRSLAFGLAEGASLVSATVTVAGKNVPADLKVEAGRAQIALSEEVVLQEGAALEVSLG